MGIIQYPSVLPGQVGVVGAAKYMVSTDSIATIIVPGYMNNVDQAVFPILPSDLLGITYNYNQQTGAGSFAWASVTIANGIITVVPNISPGSVLLPVVSGDYASFNGTSGEIKDSGQAPSNAASPFAVTSPGSLTIGNFPKLADAKGTIANGLPPSASANSFVVVSPGSMTTGHLLSAGDANGTLADSGVVATAVAISSITNPDPSSDLVWHDVTCSAAALAAAGHVTVQASTAAKQYVVRDIRVNYSASGLSGGGGDRLLVVTDGTTVWNNAGITAALLGTPINTVWGGSGNPLAGTVAMDTASAAGVTIYAAYSGGAADYTTGSVVISVLVQRTA